MWNNICNDLPATETCQKACPTSSSPTNRPKPESAVTVKKLSKPETEILTPPTDTPSISAVDSFQQVESTAQNGAKKTIYDREKLRVGVEKTKLIEGKGIATAHERLNETAIKQAKAASSGHLDTREFSQLSHDTKLFEQALTDRNFSNRDAQTAFDRSVRDSLASVADARAIRERALREDDRLAKQLATLTSMASLAFQRGNSLENASSGETLKTRTPASRERGSSIDASAVELLGATNKRYATQTDSTQSEEARNANPIETSHDKVVKATGPSEQDRAEMTKKTAELLARISKLKESPLKERLRRMLAEERSRKTEALLESVDAKDHFSGRLREEAMSADSLDARNDKKISLGERIVSDALKASEPGYSISNVEVEVTGKLMKEDIERPPGADRGSASTFDPSIQGFNSASLFARIQSAHRSWASTWWQTEPLNLVNKKN